MCAASGASAFVQRLAQSIRDVGGPAYDGQRAFALAHSVWAELGGAGPDSFPHLVQHEDLRFVCQWEEEPPIMTVMLWDGAMWRDMERIALPGDSNV